MKNVCVLIRSLADGGAEKQALLLARALQREHRTVLAIVSRDPRHPKHLEFIERHRIDHVFLPFSAVRKLLALRTLLRRRRIDVLFSFLPSDTMLGALAGSLAGTERIFGGLRNTKLRGPKEHVLRILHNRVLDHTISNSHRAAEFFQQRGFRASKMLVIPNGIDIASEPLDRRPSPRLTVLSVGRLVPQKDHATALRSIAIAARTGGVPEIRYVLAGRGPLEGTIRGWIEAEGLAEIARLDLRSGPLDDLFREADLYLCSSKHEGLSNAIMEAMNSGLPIVATDVGDNDRLVRDGVNGFLAPAGDAKALARGILELARAPDLRASFGASSRRILRDEYSFETFQATYLEIVDGKLPRPRRILAEQTSTG